MIAATILQQIGGRQFVTMTGSRDFMDLRDGQLSNSEIITVLTVSHTNTFHNFKHLYI